jgi:hypothetical protein
LEDWALIRRLAAEGVPKARIAERLGISRTTVVKAVQSESPPRYERRAVRTSFTPFEACRMRWCGKRPACSWRTRVLALASVLPGEPVPVLARPDALVHVTRDGIGCVGPWRAGHLRGRPRSGRRWASTVAERRLNLLMSRHTETDAVADPAGPASEADFSTEHDCSFWALGGD